MHKRTLHSVIMCTFLLSCTENVEEAPPSIDQPNVLLIVIDTLRADYLSPYGAPVLIAPFLHEWSKKSVVFTRHYTTSSWTRPGFATLLTGLYPSEAGIYEERFDRLDFDIETLPEKLTAHGYYTFAVNSNPNIDPYFGFQQGFSYFGEAGTQFSWMNKDSAELEKPFIPADKLTDASLQHMKTISSKPWFGMLVYIDPHQPYAPPKEDIDAVRNLSSKYHQEYSAEVHHADRQINRLLTTLKKEKMLENTLVLITSDHGEGLWSHPSVPDSFSHGTYLYDSTNHVPLLIWHPSLSHRILDDVTSSISIAGTILDWTTENFSAQPDRPSLRELIETGTQDGIPAVAFSQTHWKKMNKRSVRSAQGRYIYSQDAYDFQFNHRVEGGLPSRERGTLEGPVKELYRRLSCSESILLCWQEYQEEWSMNRIAFSDTEQLGAQLEQWHNNTQQKPPIQHDPADGYTLFSKEDKTLSVIEFVLQDQSEDIRPLPDDMIKQLEQLGYLE